uniref:Follistatin-like n=1 Tax=Saccoglossus kowalevskii TaxID=10224 RepID=A0ABM0GSY5_SACKO|nr:PREDICTED: follistatin-like [Saccoglossus kowalevskii]
MTKKDCCASGALRMAWSADDVSFGTLFKWKVAKTGPLSCILCQDSCEHAQCGRDRRCKMNRKNKPRCVCSLKCSRDERRGAICGTDSRTYANKCAMRKYRCKQRRDIEVAYHGECQTTCNGVVCPGNLSCIVDQHNRPHCVSCQTECPSPAPYDMLCGLDGVTYESSCQLMAATCLLGSSIGVAYSGRCRGPQSCDKFSCIQGKKCLVTADSGIPQCVTCNQTDCNKETDPDGVVDNRICGSDNQTYQSCCEMRKSSCNKGISIEIKHFGQCENTTLTPTQVSPKLMTTYHARVENSTLVDWTREEAPLESESTVLGNALSSEDIWEESHHSVNYSDDYVTSDDSDSVHEGAIEYIDTIDGFPDGRPIMTLDDLEQFIRNSSFRMQ